jgi:hypothetical protein
MSLDVDAHRSGHSKDSINKRATSTRTRTDEEFHHGHENGEEAPDTNPADASSDASSCPSDDEFGEAADDQLPDQAFLEAILIEFHPDRLNLLEPENCEPALEDTPAPTPVASSAS